MAARVVCPEGQAEPRQIGLFDSDSALAEACRYHPRQSEVSVFPWLTWNWMAYGQPMRQKAIPAGRLGWLMGQIAARPDWRREHHFVVQNEFKAQDRRALNLWRFGLLWADVDLRSESHDSRTVDLWTRKALLSCIDLGIPEPSLIVWSGRGLHLKWTFDEALSAQALPRWAAAMRAISAKFKTMQWPVDDQATDVSRVLRIAGTVNPKPDQDGRIIQRPVYVTHEGPDYSFDYLCEWLLPYTRAQVQQFRDDDQARAEADAARRQAWEAAGAQWAQFDANRRKAAAMLSRSVDAAMQAAGEAGQSLWWHRLDVLRQVAASRGGIAQGQRNEWLWVATNALAWGLGDAGKLWHELPQLVREIAPTLTIAEARNSASSVYQRLKKDGRDGLYRMRTGTLIDMLGLTSDEAAGLRGSGHGTKNPGALGLEKMAGLSFEEWQAETRRRFAAGGQYSARMRDETALIEARRRAQRAAVEARLQATESKRSAARRWRAIGMGLSAIAFNLDVSVATVHRWCKDQF